MRILQSKDELIVQLQDQLAFLRASAAAYDAGHYREGKRLALTLRILLHDTKRSTALLTSLGIKSAFTFYDHYPPPSEHEVIMHVGIGIGLGESGVRYMPNLYEPSRSSSFDDYWNALAFKIGADEYRRGEIILSVAEMDGGAHVDPGIAEKYARLARAFACHLNVHVDGVPTPFEAGPELAMVRQYAYEVELTLTRQAPRLLSVTHL